jgi:nucleoside 2-deoxyribosyltransferase
MTEKCSFCFFIMPFTPESHFLYLHLKNHIETNHPIQCERADESGGRRTIPEKIIDYIRKSDVIIADCSGGNPNVMYELGIAKNMDKEIIYITKDRSESIPSDIRSNDFINYSDHKPKEFMDLMDNTLKMIFSEKYESLYKMALEFHNQFNKDFGLKTKSNKKEAVMELIKSDRIPQSGDPRILKQFLLPKIIVNSGNEKVMEKIVEWID